MTYPPTGLGLRESRGGSSFGKTNFDFPEKSNKYIYLYDDIGQEGKTLQKNLDTLGQYGWELISIVGTIGGDQQLVLKRKFDPSLVKRDDEAIKKKNEKIKYDMEEKNKKDIEEKLKLETALKQKKVLVNMDEVDQQTELEHIDETVKQYIQKIVDDYQGDNILSKNIKDNILEYDICIEYDLTDSHLSNINEYRQSLVDNYLAGC